MLFSSRSRTNKFTSGVDILYSLDEVPSGIISKQTDELLRFGQIFTGKDIKNLCLIDGGRIVCR